MAIEYRNDQTVRFVVTVIISIAAALWLFPFVWNIVASLKTPSEITADVWGLPSGFHWANYERAFRGLNYTRTLSNSLFVATSAALLQCVTGTLAGFAFARIEFPGRDLVFGLCVATLMIPTTLTITANFIILQSLGWIDTYLALIIPQAASGFSIFLLRQFFATIPIELEHAARIDGAGRGRFLVRIVAPLSKPALTTVFVFIFIVNYNEFLWPLIMTRSAEIRVIQIAMSRFTDELGTVDYGPLLAAAIMVLLPTIILFMVLQQAFVRGITRTGIK